MDQFVVQGDTVVVLGHVTDKFANGNHMHKSDLVFHINEEQRKIRYFQYFFDTEAAAKALRNRKP